MDAKTLEEQAAGRFGATNAFYIRPGKRHEVIDDATHVLAQLGFVFQRNGRLVEVIRAAELNGHAPGKLIEREPDALLLRELTTARAVNLLTAHARWHRFTKDGATVQIDFPSAHAGGLLADGEWSEIATLSGVIGAPTMREDGSLLIQRGYDAQSGLLFASATAFGHVKPEPTKDDAHAALKALSEPFGDFPFTTAAARSVHIAAILTAAVRRSLPTAPAIAYTAPVQGSGKTLLADSVGWIGHRVKPAHMPFATGRDEFRKLLLSVLLDGDPIALLDNVDRPLRSAELCNLLTTDRYGDRILGESRRVKLDARLMVLVTGNNLQLVGDLTRRFLIAEIDPQTERPEARADFRISDLPAYLLKNRGRLAAAALTVLRAFHVVDPPRQAQPLGSFETWSRWVREPLIWLGWDDPCKTTTQARADDPDRERLEAVLLAWYDKFASEPKTAAEVVEVAKDHIANSYLNIALRAALIDALGSEKQLEAAPLGYYLKNRRNQLVGELRFERDGKAWRVGKPGKPTSAT